VYSEAPKQSCMTNATAKVCVFTHLTRMDLCTHLTRMDLCTHLTRMDPSSCSSPGHWFMFTMTTSVLCVGRKKKTGRGQGPSVSTDRLLYSLHDRPHTMRNPTTPTTTHNLPLVALPCSFYPLTSANTLVSVGCQITRCAAWSILMTTLGTMAWAPLNGRWRGV
jgi:hypothetical protein